MANVRALFVVVRTKEVVKFAKVSVWIRYGRRAAQDGEARKEGGSMAVKQMIMIRAPSDKCPAYIVRNSCETFRDIRSSG